MGPIWFRLAPLARAANPSRSLQACSDQNTPVTTTVVFNFDSPAYTDNGVDRELLFGAMARAGVGGDVTAPSGADVLAAA